MLLIKRKSTDFIYHKVNFIKNPSSYGGVVGLRVEADSIIYVKIQRAMNCLGRLEVK
jgi:hypothetical protein